jgi:hypothetical protein
MKAVLFVNNRYTLPLDTGPYGATEGEMMKRALTATVFGGLLIFFIPQAATAHSGSANRVAGYESTAGEKDAGCATRSQDDAAHRQQDAPGEGRSHYDREHHDGNVF